MPKKTTLVASVTVMDPKTKAPVEVEIHYDPVSGGMFGIDATFADQVTDKVICPMTGEKIKLGDSKPKEPFLTTFVFGDQDSRLAAEHQWKNMDTDACDYSFTTQEALNAFCEGVEAAEGWLDSYQLDEQERKACGRGGKHLAYRVLTIKAELIAGTISDDEDEGVEGTYEVEVNNDLTDDQACDVALDIFHSAIPVGVLDDFEFSVWDGETELSGSENYESYSGCHLGGAIRKISE